MITKHWVIHFCKHHAKAETAEDPHSPIIYGINQVLWNGVGLYRREAQKPEVIAEYGHGTLMTGSNSIFTHQDIGGVLS